MCGVFFSGHMDKERLQKILPVFLRKAQKKKRIAEILFHPCKMTQDELSEEFNKDDINSFHVSDNRILEFEAANSLTL